MMIGGAALVGALGAATPLAGQWNPSGGQWGREAAEDVRIMTWNVQDGICRTNPKVEGLNNWHALVCIVAALQPDVLMLQETGDNSGNGTGSGVDTIIQLTATLELFLHGGLDPFLGGEVTAYVQKYAPAYDLPYIFVSSESDGFNRNVLLTRFPFADLNGDSVATRSDISVIVPDEYAPGGDGMIRGFLFAELDLPDETYAGDLVAGTAHLRSGSAESDREERERAAQNVAYYIDYLFNGGGAGVPDPHGKILDSPPATSLLAPGTPVVIGGDWNEDELSNGRKGPAEWLTMAALSGGTDGTDRDRGDATYDDARNPYNDQRSTQGSSKLDYLAWQDSVAALRRAFIFHSTGLPSAWYPPQILSFPAPAAISGFAADHRPVLADLVLPAAVLWPPGDMNCDGATDFGDINPFVVALSNPALWNQVYPGCELLNGDVNADGALDFGDINPFVALLTRPPGRP
jgi:endonuclease/exonuclease/phosphatase family metal-dependent hydrolase